MIYVQLTIIQRLQRRELVSVLLHRPAETPKNLRARMPRGVEPPDCIVCFLRRFDCEVDIFRGGFGDGSDDFPVCYSAYIRQ